MPRLLCCALLLVLGEGCNDGPADAEFGYDARPVNTSCTPPPRPSSAFGVQLQQVWKELTPAFLSPVLLLQAPGEPDRFYVLEQGGKVRAMKAGDTTATDVLVYTGSDIVAGGELGLLGMAFAPDWPQSRTAYISRTIPGGSTGYQSLITRIKSTDGGKTLDRATEQPVLQFEQPFANHNGGNIVFGPDGYLYLGFGDGGSGGDPMGNGQNLGTLLGKMLRIDVAGGATYVVPPDNPFVGDAKARGEIWAYGLRNPWRWSFDRQTGQLWAGDVGQNLWEEIDIITRGGNYGWNLREGKHCYGADPCPTAGLIDPVWDYAHTDGVAVIGGYVYRGSAIPQLVGTYLFADAGSGKLWGLFPSASDGSLAAQELLETGVNPSSFGEGADGELYLTDNGTGAIWKIVPGTQPGAIGFPQKLSQLGCMDPLDPSKPGPGLIPYTVNVPFWSDGADKQRWVALPDGKQAHILPDGDIDFPNGTVLVKSFTVGNTLIETRLFMRHDDGVWAGYTYEWDADGKDATLVLGGKKKALSDTQSWIYPSGAQCLTCHNDAAGHSLGPELRQLNTLEVYPATNRRAPQLETWSHLGLFDTPLPSQATAPDMGPAPPEAQAALPVITGDPSGQTPVSPDARARAWLHVNCSFCHRPMGPGRGPQDLRVDRSFKETMLCGTAPTEGDLGVAGATLLTPGLPEKSIVSLRIHALDDKRMPPLASLVVDQNGADIIDTWIRSLTACPP
jgi:uncharacterized repeat protein (TIGR03806 family)